MKDGRNEFPMKLGLKELREIASLRDSSSWLESVPSGTLSYEELHMLLNIQALAQYMKQFHVDPGFEVVVE